MRVAKGCQWIDVHARLQAGGGGRACPRRAQHPADHDGQGGLGCCRAVKQGGRNRLGQALVGAAVQLPQRTLLGRKQQRVVDAVIVPLAADNQHPMLVALHVRGEWRVIHLHGDGVACS